MKYLNLINKEVRYFDIEELEEANKHGQWINYDIVENKIVLVSINDYKVFPKDELGVNRSKIIPLLQYFKPINKESALKIGKYYRVCPYCSEELVIKDILILDCREQFSNIKKMQLDVYNEVSCCSNTYSIPFPKTKSNIERANYIKSMLDSNATVFINYLIKSLNVEILIGLESFFKLDFTELIDIRNKRLIEEEYECFEEVSIKYLDDYLVMQKIFKDNLYLAIKEQGEIISDEVILDDLKRQILYYLNRRR